MRLVRWLVWILIGVLVIDIALQLAVASQLIQSGDGSDHLSPTFLWANRVVVLGLLGMAGTLIWMGFGWPMSSAASTRAFGALPLLAALLAIIYQVTFDPYYFPRHLRNLNETGWGDRAIVISAVAGLLGAAAVWKWRTARPYLACLTVGVVLLWSAIAITFAAPGH